MKKKIVVFTGAGISAESGLGTFRGSGGIWNDINVEDVATPAAWQKNKELVLEFYNKRRRDCLATKPNKGHLSLVDLEDKYDVTIVTQNIDNLHERAGSSRILHLHGEILKSRSTNNPKLVYDCLVDINIGDKCETGSQLRPHIVWFGETPFNLIESFTEAKDADILIVIGTSLNVYPAANIISVVNDECRVICIDPSTISGDAYAICPVPIEHIMKKASKGVPSLVKKLLK